MKYFVGLCSVQIGALLLDSVLSHGHNEDSTMDTNVHVVHSEVHRLNISNSVNIETPNYFRHIEYSNLIIAHIVLMSAAWIFVLPLGVMLSLARSRFYLLAQSSFFVLNSVGALLVTIYNSNTPDLYPSNAHHSLGWVLTWIVCVQTLLAFLLLYAWSGKEARFVDERIAFIPISTDAIEEHQKAHDHLSSSPTYRFSNDSGQGTERNTESLRSQSISISDKDNEHQISDVGREFDVGCETREKRRIVPNNALDIFLMKLPEFLSSSTLLVLEFIYEITDRLILIFGFVALSTGLVTYGGIFRGSHIYSGLAHFIKGGIFFWYGILTLGRWTGCFADLGWAWNIKPSQKIVGTFKASMPSAEFVESFLIFLYGSTNVFLEHLGSSDGVWSAQDLEHVAITVMFFGGGLCGMLIESSRIREMLNVTITNASSNQSPNRFINQGNEDPAWLPPKTYRISMNPIPALIILLLGFMMSSHHQASMVSTMVHKQWGTLLIGAAFSRALTYIILYLSPPTSLLPSRPPSEIIAAFCLMAGGLIFMASSHDTVLAMEVNDINAMFVFTVTAGFVTSLMAWIIIVIAIKGWAVRRKSRDNHVDISRA